MMPGRLVLHKTSKYYDDELDGFTDAMAELGIFEYDIVTIMETDLRFFRNNSYPQVRGSLFTLSKNRFILYTSGPVHQYQTYPGMYNVVQKINYKYLNIVIKYLTFNIVILK